jgi:hypothetical protein
MQEEELDSRCGPASGGREESPPDSATSFVKMKTYVISRSASEGSQKEP